MEASAKPASKAAAWRVWVPADKPNKLKEDSAETTEEETEKKATDTVSDESRKLWADEPVDPRYIGEDIDLGTVTPEQLPELRRRAEHAMARKREEHAAHQQATLQKEIAVEKLRLQKLKLREEAARLERSRATDTSAAY